MWLRILVSLVLVQYLNGQCDVCQTNRAACHSQNTYSICINGKASKNIITCPTNYVCTDGKYICYAESHNDPICKPVVDLNAYCNAIGKPDNYENKDDPTCKTFIYCYENGSTGRLIGLLKTCSNKKPYFNGTACDTAKPDFCT
ncbi:uncharacterized protein LOC115563757 [Drosophila navojoa]|uniref:uncharacterized protein LOC115563757 n=1 Tax=Drosophila navojoa TaxID=7232 RepID=UPI0011BE9578|nr:uncharacterized protein LOC115563757 [Drosophila navojoa]